MLTNRIENQNWNQVPNPFFTIITPVYNREKTLHRTLMSVEAQTFRNMEYIIIDDGSADTSREIARNYLEHSSLPVCLLEKENGGVHTARNEGYKAARGQLIICIDSDDELLPTACEVFHRVWQSIPEAKRNEYWQIKARCKNQRGEACSKPFPENINEMDREEAYAYFSTSKGEQIGCRSAKIMKNNLFPEPENVKFVTEVVVWLPLEKKYRSWATNEYVRIYHQEGEDHLSNVKTKSIQSCRNAMWNSAYALNHKELFIRSGKKYIVTLLRYNIMKIILSKDEKPVEIPLENRAERISALLLWLPSLFGAKIYRKKYLKGD